LEPVIAASNICCSANGTIAAAIIISFVEVQPLSLGRNTCRCCIAGYTITVQTTDFKDVRAIGPVVTIVTDHKMTAVSFIIFKESSPTQPFSILGQLNYFSKA
jgi:hypothetical protein